MNRSRADTVCVFPEPPGSKNENQNSHIVRIASVAHRIDGDSSQPVATTYQNEIAQNGIKISFKSGSNKETVSILRQDESPVCTDGTAPTLYLNPGQLGQRGVYAMSQVNGLLALAQGGCHLNPINRLFTKRQGV
jgi:hypothetical protein